MFSSLQELLEDWDCSNLCSIFDANDITPDNIFELDAHLIKELIPNVGRRMKFQSKFLMEKSKRSDLSTATTFSNISDSTSKYDTASDVTLTSDDVDEIRIQVDENISLEKDHELNLDLADTPIDSIENYILLKSFPDFDLKTLLSTTPLGLSILKFYQTNNRLDMQRRTRLTDIIIKHIFNYIIKQRLKHEQYNILTSKIISLFPTESTATYYVPAIKKINSPSGRPILAKGKLVDKCRNLLHHCSDVVSPKKRRNAEDSNIKNKCLVLDDYDEKLKNDVIWLKTRNEPWSTVMEKWSNTFIVRQNNTSSTIADFINEWPSLKDLRAEVLIDLDFEKLFPEASLKLILNWDDFFDKIVDERKENLKDNHTVELLNLLEHLDKDQNKDTYFRVQLLLLPYLVPPKGRLTLRKDQKSCHWKFSTIESAEAIICHAKNPGDVKEIINIQKTKSASRKQTLQPFLIVEGPSIDDINSTYVIVDELRYQFSSTKKAFDICFKLFHVTNAQYPVSAEHLYLLIQMSVFRIKTKNDKIIPYIMDIIESTVH